jgi:hypothetical protein
MQLVKTVDVSYPETIRLPALYYQGRTRGSPKTMTPIKKTHEEIEGTIKTPEKQ